MSSGYYGPRIEFNSIRDYQPISNVTAEQLPQLVEGRYRNGSWPLVLGICSRSREPWDSHIMLCAEFLTRLLNELPAGDKRQDDLATLKETLTPLFRPNARGVR